METPSEKQSDWRRHPDNPHIVPGDVMQPGRLSWHGPGEDTKTKEPYGLLASLTIAAIIALLVWFFH